MTFGEKLKSARLANNLSQLELGEKLGVSEKAIYNYEQTGAFPRRSKLLKLAEILNVSVAYLMDDTETDKHMNIDHDFFLSTAKQQFGNKGALEASMLLSRATALFAGGELEDEAKDKFFQSIMEVYLESKAEAREKFTPKKRKSRKA